MELRCPPRGVGGRSRCPASLVDALGAAELIITPRRYVKPDEGSRRRGACLSRRPARRRDWPARCRRRGTRRRRLERDGRGACRHGHGPRRSAGDAGAGALRRRTGPVVTTTIALTLAARPVTSAVSDNAALSDTPRRAYSAALEEAGLLRCEALLRGARRARACTRRSDRGVLLSHSVAHGEDADLGLVDDAIEHEVPPALQHEDARVLLAHAFRLADWTYPPARRRRARSTITPSAIAAIAAE